MNNKCVKAFFCITYEAEVGLHPKSSDRLTILESNPDVNYYGSSVPEITSTPLEHHLFVLADKGECFVDNAFKYIHKLEGEIGKKLHIYPGQLKLEEGVFMSLRFRENEFDYTMEFVDYLKDRLNWQFKIFREYHRGRAIIHYKKYIELEELYPDIYKDKNSKRVYFVKLSSDMELFDFYKLVSLIRRNHRFHSFEPFYAYAMMKYYEIEYFFMFYSPGFVVDDLPRLKEALDKEIMKI